MIEEGRLRTTPEAFKRRFDSEQPLRIAIEVGTHSPWVSRVLKECGHEVLVANPRRLHLIYGERRKDRQARCPEAGPSGPGGSQASRPATTTPWGGLSGAPGFNPLTPQALVNARTQLVNHVRGSVKSFGGRLSRCSTASFHKKVADQIPQELRSALEPLLQTIASLSASIEHYDHELEALAQEHYPETKLLRQVPGVGTLTALTFVLTLEDPGRFEESRQR